MFKNYLQVLQYLLLSFKLYDLQKEGGQTPVIPHFQSPLFSLMANTIIDFNKVSLL